MNKLWIIDISIYKINNNDKYCFTLSLQQQIFNVKVKSKSDCVMSLDGLVSMNAYIIKIYVPQITYIMLYVICYVVLLFVNCNNHVTKHFRINETCFTCRCISYNMKIFVTS